MSIYLTIPHPKMTITNTVIFLLLLESLLLGSLSAPIIVLHVLVMMTTLLNVVIILCSRWINLKLLRVLRFAAIAGNRFVLVLLAALSIVAVVLATKMALLLVPAFMFIGLLIYQSIDLVDWALIEKQKGLKSAAE